MKFDKNNVYSYMDADVDFEIGQYGIFANSYSELLDWANCCVAVEDVNKISGLTCGHLGEVDFSCTDCFRNSDIDVAYEDSFTRYFYPVEELKPKYRPYKDAQECLIRSSNYVVRKEGPRVYHRVLEIGDNRIIISVGCGTKELFYEELLEKYNWQGNLPCGVELDQE